jgi:hypothetical protein
MLCRQFELWSGSITAFFDPNYFAFEITAAWMAATRVFWKSDLKDGGTGWLVLQLWE